MIHRIYLGFRFGVLLLILVGLPCTSPAVEKFAVLGKSDLVFTGKAGEFQWRLILWEWKFMWALHAEVEVNEVLLGPRELRGQRIAYVFRCSECPLFAFPPEIPRYFGKEALWFVRRSGSRWEPAWGASGDACIRPLCDADNFRRFLRREPMPYPHTCRPEDGR